MLLGHQKILDHLKSLAAVRKLHHAQLFAGPEHVGKTHTALLLASHLQCGENNTILKKHIFEGVHADTILYLDDGESLSIERMRDLLARSGQSHQAPYLIFILENLGRMKPEAANLLLKTLEEPGEGTLFLLTANQEEDVLPTIRSRCHTTSFQTLANPEMEAACEEHVHRSQLLLFAMGRPGKLLRLQNDSAYLQAHQDMLGDLVQFLEQASAPAAFRLIRRYEKSEFLPELLDILLQRTRTWVLAGQSPIGMTQLELTAFLDRIETSKQDLKNHVNTKLILETLFLSYVPSL